jgi:rRNA maturation endonuclease Nob1
LHRWNDRATIVLRSRPSRRLRSTIGGKGGRVAQYEAYCVKCKAKRQFEGTVVTLKNGRNAASGTCPVCGTKVMRILGKADVAAS